MFAIELMMPELSARTFLPVALATGTATFIGRIYFGIHPTFAIPTEFLTSQHPSTFDALILFALLGALIGLAATAFVRGLTLAEDLFEHIRQSLPAPHRRDARARHSDLRAIPHRGPLLRRRRRLFDDPGHSQRRPQLPRRCFFCSSSQSSAPPRQASARDLRAGFSLRRCSWAPRSAGRSAPLINSIHAVEGVSVTTAAIIGMAAMVGGGTGAAMTAVTMIFEMTRDYDLVMPSIVAVALAIGVRRLLSQENIYTIKLVGRGHFVPKALHANMFLVRRAGEVMERDVAVVPADADFDAFLRQHAAEPGFKHVVVMRGNRIAGVVRVNTSLRRGIEAAYSGVRFRRYRTAQFHTRARDRHHVRRGATHGAPQRRHGGGDHGRWPLAARANRRRHL